MIHYYVHGRGRGHAIRSRSVIEILQVGGYKVRVFAGSSEAAKILGLADCEIVQPVMPGMGLRVWLPLVWRRVGDAYRAMRNDPAQVVITDGDAPACLAANFARIPIIAVGHGLIFCRCHRPENIPAAPWYREALKAILASLGSRFQVAVSLVPLQPRSASTIVAAPALRNDLGSRKSQLKGALCYFRDANGGQILEWLKILGEHPIVFSDRPPDVSGIDWKSPDLDEFAEYLRCARYVISSAGSNLIAECTALGVPQLALYRHDDDEQRLNMAMLDHQQFHSARFDQFELADLQRFIGRLPERSDDGCQDLPWAGLPNPCDAVAECVHRLIRPGPVDAV